MKILILALVHKIWNWTTYAEWYCYPSGTKGWRRSSKVLRLFGRKKVAERKIP